MGCPLLSLLWTCWLDTCVFYGRRHQHGRRNLISDLFHLKKLTKHSSFSESLLKYSSRSSQSLTKMLLNNPLFFFLAGVFDLSPSIWRFNLSSYASGPGVRVREGRLRCGVVFATDSLGTFFPSFLCHFLTFKSYSSILYTIAASPPLSSSISPIQDDMIVLLDCTSTLMKSRSPLSGDGKI